MKYTWFLFLVLIPICIKAQQKPIAILTDTSQFFVAGSVDLTFPELQQAENLLRSACDEFNTRQRLLGDSLNPKKKRRMFQAIRLTAHSYYYRLITSINNDGQKIVRLNGISKEYFKRKEINGSGNANWKDHFTEADLVADGGTTFIQVEFNLTLQNHNKLTINGLG